MAVSRAIFVSRFTFQNPSDFHEVFLSYRNAPACLLLCSLLDIRTPLKITQALPTHPLRLGPVQLEQHAASV